MDCSCSVARGLIFTRKNALPAEHILEKDVPSNFLKRGVGGDF
jgi:hypothetical protein